MTLTIISDTLQQAIKNPFGLNFELQSNKIYIPLGSAINCLGYNDHLERMIGAARVALGLAALVQSSNNQDKLTAGAHIFRGILEMMGNFELYLLIIDCAFTVNNIAQKALNSSSK